MARVDTLTNFLTDVAGAIKEKKGDNTPIQASNFDTEIENLPSGGGDLDWSAIGYSEEPKKFEEEEGYNYAIQIKNSWQPSTSLFNKFNSDKKLIYMPVVDTSSANNMYSMFGLCYYLRSVPQLNTSNVTTMERMFYRCYSLTGVPLFDTGKVTTTDSMFIENYKIEEIPLLDISKVTNANSMFGSCENLKKIPLLDTSSIVSMRGIFSGCKSLTDESLDNILRMCINATNYTGTKTLKAIGFEYMTSVYPVSRIQALTHYQDFIDAGWTIGY